MTAEQQVRRYLASGDCNLLDDAWPGRDIIEKAGKAERVIKTALVEEIRRRTRGQPGPSLPPAFDPPGFVLGKVGPMVRGFFPAKEQQLVLGLFENSLHFVTHDSIEQLLTRMNWLGTAWNVANLYLGSLGLSGLDGKAVDFVGLSEETTFYVSMAYFGEENPFADYVVHEAAHVFHNWKRNRAGLPHTRNREFLLQIDFRKRELFAYACEAYSRIVELAGNKADRQRLLADYGAAKMPDDDRLNRTELVDILREAVAVRNGWKCILQCCSPSGI